LLPAVDPYLGARQRQAYKLWCELFDGDCSSIAECTSLYLDGNFRKLFTPSAIIRASLPVSVTTASAASNDSFGYCGVGDGYSSPPDWEAFLACCMEEYRTVMIF
jgi:hypothetical protein